MEKTMYFERPTQVAFWEEEQECYIGGIAYGDEIICGCCGGVVSIEEVYEFAPEGVNPIVAYENWAAFDKYVIADEEKFFEQEEN